jgi:hypothetical protein
MELLVLLNDYRDLGSYGCLLVFVLETECPVQILLESMLVLENQREVFTALFELGNGRLVVGVTLVVQSRVPLIESVETIGGTESLEVCRGHKRGTVDAVAELKEQVGARQLLGVGRGAVTAKDAGRDDTIEVGVGISRIEADLGQSIAGHQGHGEQRESESAHLVVCRFVS